MSAELSSQEVLENQIFATNNKLLELARIASTQMPPFDGSNISDEPLEDAKVTQITNQTNSAGFWNHYISGTIAAVDVNIEIAEFAGGALDRKLVSEAQARTIQYARMRLTSLGSDDTLESRSCKAYLAASGSFDWTSEGARSLFAELRDAVFSLGDYYMSLSGKRSL